MLKIKFDLANQLFKSESYSGAIKVLDDIIRTLPEESLEDVYILKGECYIKINEIDEAIKCYHNAISHNSEINLPYTRLLDSYRLTRNLEAGKKVVNDSLRNLPLDPIIHFHIGLFYFELDYIESSVVYFLTAFHQGKNNDALYYLGAINIQFRHFENAKSYLDIYLREEPKGQLAKYAYYQRAIGLNNLNDFEGFKSNLIEASNLGLKEATNILNDKSVFGYVVSDKSDISDFESHTSKKLFELFEISKDEYPDNYRINPISMDIFKLSFYKAGLEPYDFLQAGRLSSFDSTILDKRLKHATLFRGLNESVFKTCKGIYKKELPDNAVSFKAAESSVNLMSDEISKRLILIENE